MSWPATPGRARYANRLAISNLLANVVGSAPAIYYVHITVGRQLQELGYQLMVSTVLITAVALAIGTLLTNVYLPALRKLGARPDTADPQSLAAALAEVGRIADNASRIALMFWLWGALSIAVSQWWYTGMPLYLMPRVAWTGVLFGSLTTLLTYCLVTLRARQVMRWLTGLGLSSAEVIAAVPRRAQLRMRLVVFTAVAVAIPALITWDICSVLGERAYAVVLAQSTREAQEFQVLQLRAEILRSGGPLVMLTLALALITAWLAGTLLGQPMRELGDEAHRIAEGDLSRYRVITAEDEVWDAAAAFTTMRAHLAGVLTQLRQASTRVGSTTENLMSTSGRYEAGAAEQARSLDHVSSTTEELAHAGRHIAQNAGSVSEMAHRTLAAAKAGQASAESFLATISRMRHDNQAIAAAVFRLNKRVQAIGKIVEFITGVADKSDLLALNAELEGTKAGEVGQGFSLVAAEMRRLAENVLESTKEIEGLIEEVLDASGAAVTATEGGVRTTEMGTGLAQQVSESLRQIVDLAGRTSEAVRAISLATQQQQEGTDQLAGAMADILRITQQGYNTTRYVIRANADLSTLARDLRAVVERFQIDPPSAEAAGERTGEAAQAVP